MLMDVMNRILKWLVVVVAQVQQFAIWGSRMHHKQAITVESGEHAYQKTKINDMKTKKDKELGLKPNPLVLR